MITKIWSIAIWDLIREVIEKEYWINIEIDWEFIVSIFHKQELLIKEKIQFNKYFTTKVKKISNKVKDINILEKNSKISIK